MSQNKKLHIIVDNREQKLMALLDQKTDVITYEAKQLDIADVIITSEVAIERKEGNDFIQSIKDNRLFEQLTRLKENFPVSLLLLEGLNNDVFENTGMKIASIYGVLAKISYTMGISILPTRNLQDTVIAIERIAFREQAKKNFSVLARIAPKQMTIEERRCFIIEGLLDIGHKKAKALISKYKTPSKVFEAIKNTNIEYTRTGNPKGIKGPLKEIPKIGWKFVQKNKELIFGKQEDRKQKKIDEILPPS